jgi:hypothetical protein
MELREKVRANYLAATVLKPIEQRLGYNERREPDGKPTVN